MRGLIRVLGVAGALALAVSPAQAATIYTTFGPADSFLAESSLTIGGANLQEIAASFIPGFDATLDAIRVATRHLSGSNDYTVWLAADASGSPGPALETFSSLAFSFPASILTLNSVASPLLTAGTRYWVVISAADLSASQGGWNSNDQGFSGLSFRSTSTGGAWNSAASNMTPAFDVSASAATAVPEPATLLLLSTGLAVAARRFRASRG